MNGQWIGQYHGTNSGIAVVEIDDSGDHYEGHAYLWDGNPRNPSSFALIITENKSNKANVKVPVYAIDPHTGAPVPWDNISQAYTGYTYPNSADVEFEWNEQSLKISWVTNIGTYGSAVLPKSRAGYPSNYIPSASVQTWEQLKEYVNKFNQYDFVFRGQVNNQWRLRTSFHRTGKVNLTTYLQNMDTLHRHLSPLTSHVFNLNDAKQNGAFVSLVQHHGYPTPLLDWTYSPYVAAFFAYRHTTSKKDVSDKVRIFIFNKKQWCIDFSQLQRLINTRPHFSILEALAIGNLRMIPQQALSFISTIDDLESYIQIMGAITKKEYLEVIDLPAGERQNVMRQLSMMGVTAGSLFPGLDGACEEMRERFFQR